MDNIFDQFDEAPAGNVFDQFDEPKTGAAPEGQPAYVPDENAYVKDRKTIGGTEYRLHGPTGRIYDPAGKVTLDPAVLEAFGKTKPTKAAQAEAAAQDETETATGFTDYATEFGKAIPRGLVSTIGSGLKGAALLQAAPASESQRIEQGIAGITDMTPEAATEFMRSIPSLKINPVAAINYQSAIRARWRGDEQTAQQYLAEARKYADPRPLEQQDIYQAGEGLQQQINKDIPQDPRFAGSWTTDIGQGLGSTLAFLPAAPLGAIGVAATGALASGNEGYEAAKQDIATPRRDDRAGLYNAGLGTAAQDVMLQAGRASMAPGLSEAAPIEMLTSQIMRRVPYFNTPAGAGLLQKGQAALARIGSQVLAEGGQEAFQTWANNVINRLMVDPEQADFEGVGRAAVIGGAVGGGMQTAVEGVGAFRRDQPQPLVSQPPPQTVNRTGKGDRIEPRFVSPRAPMPEVNLPNVEGWPIQEQGQAAPPPVGQATWAPGAGPVKNIFDAFDNPDVGSRRAPVKVAEATDPDIAATRVNTQPSEAQIAAGNYAKGHLKFQGLDISIENPKGSTRRGTDPDGEAWESPAMPAHYGYIKRSVGKDGDNLDVFIGPNPQADTVYVIDQNDLKTGKFDESKTVLGASTPEEAVDLYIKSFSDGRAEDRIGAVTQLTMAEFKDWARNGNTRRPLGAKWQATPVQQKQPEANVFDQFDAARPAPFQPSAEQSKAFSDFYRTRKPVTPENVAPFVGGDLDVAGKLIQDAIKRKSLLQTKGGKLYRAPTRIKPVSMVEFIASIGGITDPTGELLRNDANKMTAYGPLVRRNGLHPDRVRERLLEEGYLKDAGWDTGKQQETTVADVLNAIIEETNGRRIYKDEDQPVIDDLERSRMAAAEADRMESEGWRPEKQRSYIDKKYGPDIDARLTDAIRAMDVRVSLAEMEQAADLMLDGMDAENALEAAIIRASDNWLDQALDDPGLRPLLNKKDRATVESWEIARAFAQTADDVVSPSQTEPAANEDVQGRAPEDGRAPVSTVGEGEQAGGEEGPQGSSGEASRPGAAGGKGQQTAVEPGAEGKPQTVIPGTEPDIKGAIRNAVKKPLKAKAPQKDADEGLFGNGAQSPDLFDKPAKKPEPKADKWKKIGVNRDGNPVFEDERGVRSYTEKGIRITETVRLEPGGGISVSSENRRPEFNVVQQPDTQTEQTPAKPNSATSKPNSVSEKPQDWKAEGAAAFKAGTKRIAPSSVMNAGAKAVSDWYDGWDRANAAAPVEGWTPAEQQAMPSYGSANTLVTKDRAAEIREKLKAKLKNQLSAGIDPELMAMGAELAAFHIEAGARKFVDFAKAIAADLETSVEKIKPYLRAWYNGARDMLEDSGQDIAGMDGPDEVKTALASLDEQAVPEEAEPQQTVTRKDLIAAFVDYFINPDGLSFDTITEARKWAAEKGFPVKAGTKEAKQLDEIIETSIVQSARVIIRASKDRKADTIYRRLIDLYERQPNLSTRTSGSMADQAYSTPVPLAFIASRLAGVKGASLVYEPTAGNGALLIEAEPESVIANELNPDRRESLKEMDYRVTGNDASVPAQANAIANNEGGADVVIENPPFGALQGENGRSKTFTVDGWDTTQIDHAIALTSLKALKDGGRAVLIVGSVKEGADKSRSDSYNSKQKREFYWRLYKDYNVTDHFTVSGDLYRRQGAGWPVDVIVIEGRGKSARSLPAVDLPRVYDTWDGLKEKLNEAPPRSASSDQRPGTEVSRPAGQPNGNEVRPTKLESGSQGDNSASGTKRPSSGGTKTGNTVPVQPAGNSTKRPSAGQQQSAPDDVGGLEPGSGAIGGRDSQYALPNRERLKANEETGEQPYQPLSKQTGLGTNVPANMASSVEDALQDIASRHGDIDAWLEKELGYEKGTIGSYLAAEQVDALAMAIDNVQKNAAMVLGDQTGIGKGRVVASALRYAMRKGLTPIFVTEKPNLYGDMIRDLNDIGIAKMLGRDIRPFLTGPGLSIPLDDVALDWEARKEEARFADDPIPPRVGKFLRSSSPSKHKTEMQDVMLNGVGKDQSFDIIFTTYDQMNTVKGADTDRRRLMNRLIGNGFLVLDESHNAGGTETEERFQKKDAAENRSDFLKRMTQSAKAVMFSSATYAKRPQTMALYSRTDMGKAVDKPEDLGPLIQRGGVPLQQIVASMLAKAGQYIRRERSFKGVSYDVEPVSVDIEAYEGVSLSLRAIAMFERELKESDTWKDIIEGLKDSASAAAMDTATGDIGVTSTNFTSLMHNIVNQMLLGLKADAVAERAIAALKTGEKPVITVANTMGAFIKQFAEDNNLAPGDAVSMSFQDVLKRYLSRTLRLTVKTPDSSKPVHINIPVDNLPAVFRRKYEDALAQIEGVRTASLPLSPIDWIRYRLSSAGYRVGEITGRKEILNYVGPNEATLGMRRESEINPGGRTVAVGKFNNGTLDVMILNRAGSTGLSLHSKKDFKDRRRRRMIIAQAEANIDTHMQMLGRVHRTGQVVPPAFSQAYADIPAEARPAAVLAKKMASLNANTTAARKSAFSADDSIDFLNKYGDQIAAEWLAEHPAEAMLLDINEDKTDGDEGEGVNADKARKLTGRMTLLLPNEQAQMMEDITARYKTMIANLDALGENALEAKTLDLKAKTVSRQVIKEGDGSSPFAQPVNLEEVEVTTKGTALPMTEIVERASAAFGKKIDTTDPAAALEQMDKIAGNIHPDDVHKPFMERFDRMVADELKNTRTPEVRETRRVGHAENRAAFSRLAYLLQPGRRVSLQVNADSAPMTGIVMEVKRREMKGETGNPLALGAWSAEIAIPDNAQRIIVPFSNLAVSEVGHEGDHGGANRILVARPDWAESPAQTVETFRKATQTGTDRRWIVTGNILAGFEKATGQIMNYTDDQGNVRPGILMARNFSARAFMDERAVVFKMPEQVVTFLTRIPDAEISSKDGNVTIRKDRQGGTEFETPAARQTGGTYFLNPGVRRVTGDGFVKVGSKMRYVTSASAKGVMDALLTTEALMKAGAIFQTKENQDIAEEVIKASGPQVRGSTGRSTPGFYSALVRAVEGMKQEKAPAAQWIGMIRNAPGVKPEEIEWLGVEDWLKEQGGPVTRAALVEFLRANQVDVQEVLKGKTSEERRAEIEAVPEDDRTLQMANELSDIEDGSWTGEPSINSTATKFSQYTLPGGKNYRELLLTLPEKPTPAAIDAQSLSDQIADMAREMRQKYGPMWHEGMLTEQERQDYNDLHRMMDVASDTASDEARKTEYRSGHWNEPNVLAHVRFNERTDADGKRVLFIEEIQSDWHQQGRKTGYKQSLTKEDGDALVEERRRLLRKIDPRSAGYDELTADDIDDVNARIQEIGDIIAASNGVPDAPFKTTWPELALKRMVRWAAEHGFDTVAWTPGDVQAERYDLSKQVDSLLYKKNADGTYQLSAQIGGRGQMLGTNLTEAQVEANVGKDVAEKIVKGEGKRTEVQGKYDPVSMTGSKDYMTQLSGLDLKVGGEGMKGFYDTILVAAANKLGKKFGAKVGKSRLPGSSTYEQLVEAGRATGLSQSDLDAMPVAERKRVIDANTPAFHSLDITPAMRTAAMGGMPLFKDTKLSPTSFVVSKKQLMALNVKAQALSRRINGRNLDVSVVEKMPDFVPKDFIAAYSPSQRAVWLSLKAASDMAFNIGHESMHSLRQTGAITPDEWNVLTKAAAQRGYIDNLSRERIAIYTKEYGGRYGMSQKQVTDLLVEEAVADMFGDYINGQEMSTPVARIFARIKEFIESLLSLLKGEGFVTADTIMGAASRGSKAGTPVAADADPNTVMGSSRDITKTDAFKRWFGDSKVVDENGEPLVMYHGTTADFDTFDMSKTGKGFNLLGKGFYFGSEFNASVNAKDGNVMPVFLRATKPFRTDAVALSNVKVKKLQDNGHDAIFQWYKKENMIQNTAPNVVVVFSPNQIKSAIGNSGAFDPGNPSILGNTGRRMPASSQAIQSAFAEPEDDPVAVWQARNQPLFARIADTIGTAARPYRRKLQDKMTNWAAVEGAITSQLGTLDNSAKVYRTEVLYAGRAGERLEDLRMDEILPLVDKMVELGISQKEIDQYLYARHAPERNAHIATIDPTKPDGGSGMTNAEAQQIMQAAQQSGKLAALRTIARMIDGIQQQTRDRLLRNGIIDGTTYQGWQSAYQYYVPFRGFEANPDEDNRLPSGQRYDTRTKVAITALGRRSRADSPLAYIVAQAQQSIILSEKARVGRAVLNMADKYPNPNLWEVNQVVTKKFIDPLTGLVATRIDGTARTRAENVLAVRKGGKLYWVTIHHDGLASGIKGLDGQAMNAVMRMGLTINRYLAMVRTGLDPQFFIPNFIRDLTTAGIHISADQGGVILRGTLKDLPRAMAGAFRGERGNLSSQWAQYYREFAQAGGKVGVFGLETIETIKSRMARDLALAKGGPAISAVKAGQAVLKFVGDINAAIESAIRLALYVNMRRTGYSIEDSAYAAKEVTVNFNRKGEWGNGINAAYLFFNASIQGTARIALALAKSKWVRRAAFGMFLSGILMDVLNAAMSGDSDDDGEDDYDQIPEYVKERNFIIVWPGGKKGEYTAIPLPWVYNVFFYAGQNISRASRGKASAWQATANVMGALAQAANPLYSNSWVQMVSPSLLDPAIDIYMNEDWKGDPIMPSQNPFGVPAPDSQRYFESVGPASKQVADALNSMTGGDEVRPGSIDISPESIDYIGEFVLGGIGGTFNQTVRTVNNIVSGEEILPERIPFVRKVFGRHVSSVGREEFYKMADEVELTMAQIKHYQDAGDREKVAELKSKYAADVKAAPVFKAAEKRLKTLRKRRDAAASAEDRNKVVDEINALMAKTRKRYRDLLRTHP